MTASDLHTKCWELIRQRKFKEAVQVSRMLCQSHPHNSESWYSLSNAARCARLNNLALQAIEKAIDLNPNNLEFLAHKALCLLSTGSVADAIKLARKIKEAESPGIYALNTIAQVFRASDEFIDHLEVTRDIVDLSPANIVGLSNYADALKNLGRLQEAETEYSKVIALDPSAYSAYWSRSQTIKSTKNHNYVKSLSNKLLESNLPWRAEMQLCYALAKELEDLGVHEESFEYLTRGSNLRRKHSNYDVSGDIATIEKIVEMYQDISKFDDGFETNEPIFVLGLPRSGTTLVERILGGHSDVFDAGELQSFSSELVKQIQVISNGNVTNKIEAVEASVRLDWRQLGKSYIESTRGRTGHTSRFVDKMPNNYLYIGLIAAALPGARIVLVERNPMDSCYAIYKTLFAEAYPFSYSLRDLGNYYVAWRGLMEHWKALLPSRIYTLKYEMLINNTKETVSDLLKYCDLDWQPGCIDFHNRSTGVSTASASQVRQPIYKTSVGKWHCYEEQLKPLAEILLAANIDID